VQRRRVALPRHDVAEAEEGAIGGEVLGPVGVGDEEVLSGDYCGDHGLQEVFRH